jgi:hypothetical protein
MRAVGLIKEFALGAAVVVVAAKENMVAVEVVGARMTVRGMAAGMTSVHVVKAVKPIAMKCLTCVISLSGNSLEVFVGESEIL